MSVVALHRRAGQHRSDAGMGRYECAVHRGIPAAEWVGSTTGRSGRWLCARCVGVTFELGKRRLRREWDALRCWVRGRGWWRW